MSESSIRDRAPVALFVYARPEHTRLTIEALSRNAGAEETDLIVYADGSRGQRDAEKVAATRAVVHEATGFRSVRIVERDKNLGLVGNVEGGVTEAIERHGRTIVVEDDIVTAPEFLNFMNAALDRYQNDHRVWHISGWNYPIDPDGLPDCFFWRVMNCWGWATWSDRWCHYQRNPAGLRRQFTRDERRAFNLDGAHDFFSQIEDNETGCITTWAIFWYASIFRNGGLCLNPTISLVQNIGFDGTGEHCGVEQPSFPTPSRISETELPEDIAENAEAVVRIRAHLRKYSISRFINRLKFLVYS